MGDAVGVLAGLTRKAAVTLGLMLDCNNQQYQIAAARAVFEYCGKLRENVEIADELARLRRDMEQMRHEKLTQRNTCPEARGTNNGAFRAPSASTN
jgi:hypothetical protein